MTDSENNTETKDTAKPDPVTTAPYIKKDDTAGSPQAKSEKKKSSVALTISLLLAVVIIISITTYKFNEEVSNLSGHKVAETSTQIDTEKSETITEAITPASAPVSTNNKDTAIHSTQGPRVVANNNDVTKQRRQAYTDEMQSRQKQYQEMMAARQQEMTKNVEAQKEKYNRFRQEQLKTKMEIQEIRKQVYQLNERLRYLMQKTYPRNNR
jgi:hypothetical protein